MHAKKHSDQTEQLVGQAVSGDPHALGELMSQYQPQLTNIVAFRMDRRLQSRVDAADVVQEAFIEAAQRLGDYQATTDMPFFLWLRFIALQKLMQLHRHHLGVKARDAGREISIFKNPVPQATSAVLAAQLLGGLTSPSHAAMRIETKLQMERALNEMDEIDREILALRHFEQLNNAETAKLLEISQSASSNRYIRALKRLKTVMDRLQNTDISGIYNESKE